ncbi:FecR family protein [Taibaiella koreensis]|uniref:FecR family protein n=1 Tax=Taibaiella koreensis TaxID=1268548 RepID=UPI000E5A073D|nr:FecR domain-containing protein [Taibaiella koreensis]
MDNYKLLLEKFWRGDASETEKLQLYKTILKDEEAIRAALQQELISEKKELLSPEISLSILESLHREIGARASHSIERPRKSLSLFKWAAALLVMGLASFIGWTLYTTKNDGKQNAGSTTTYAIMDNNGKDIKLVVLDDGTAVELYPESAIRLKQPFNRQSTRSIRLTGKASFKVKHDATRPFEVIANNIKTTDIGTEFYIDAPDLNTFKVALKEGSIRVAAMPNSSIRMEETTLEPGDEMHWDLTSKKMILTQTARQKKAETPDHNVATPPAMRERLVFDKTPLDKVFAKLASQASAPIRYNAAEIKELTFTGTIEPSDDIGTALDIICNLNGLHYQKKKQAFIVAKDK